MNRSLFSSWTKNKRSNFFPRGMKIMHMACVSLERWDKVIRSFYLQHHCCCSCYCHTDSFACDKKISSFAIIWFIGNLLSLKADLMMIIFLVELNMHVDNILRCREKTMNLKYWWVCASKSDFLLPVRDANSIGLDMNCGNWKSSIAPQCDFFEHNS